VTICVYALIGRTHARLVLDGVAGERLRAVAAGHIAAIAGEVRRMPAPSIRNLRRYAAIMDALASKVPALLPARFGTVVADPAELTFILRSRARTFRAGLRHVRGRRQMTIHLFSESEYGVGVRRRNRSTAAAADVLRLQRGTQYLRRKMAERAAEQAIPPVIDAAVRAYIKDQQVERRGGIVTIHHLVPRAAASKYRAAVERSAHEHGMRLIVTGPWPPYAFAATW
jgi:hypothetical protein